MDGGATTWHGMALACFAWLVGGEQWTWNMGMKLFS